MVLCSYLASANMQKISLPQNTEHKFCESVTGESLTLFIGVAVPSEFAPVRPLPPT